MANFKDAQGKTWVVIVTAGLLRRLKALGYDLAVIIQKEPWRLADPDVIGELLWQACEPSKPEHGGLTIEQFLERLDGDAMHAAIAAYMSAFVDFSHGPSTRATAHQTMERAKQAAEQHLIQTMESAVFSPDVLSSAGPSGSPGSPTRSPN